MHPVPPLIAARLLQFQRSWTPETMQIDVIVVDNGVDVTNTA
jgi:hypothetical protein